MSTEADIVEKTMIDRLRRRRDDLLARDAADLITKLRAELEDAYIEARNHQNMGAKEARDMRERCASVADDYLAGGPIAAEIRGLSLLATEGDSQ